MRFSVVEVHHFRKDLRDSGVGEEPTIANDMQL